LIIAALYLSTSPRCGRYVQPAGSHANPLVNSKMGAERNWPDNGRSPIPSCDRVE